nr:hypothetical protein [uncultured Flavobacterium sp.]
MKKILAIATLAVLASCSSNKGVVSTNWLGKHVVMKSECPENGTCTATRDLGKGLKEITSDNTIYPQIVENNETILIQYEYNRKKSEGNYADDFHKEELFLAIPAKAFKKEYKNEQLQEVKLIYGRHCYCKGSAGYFKISEGTLKIDNSEEKTKVKLTFKAPVEQLISTVDFIVE